MKQIFIRKENFDLKKLMESLERETSVVGRDSRHSPLKRWPEFRRMGNILAVDCDSRGLIVCTYEGSLETGREIHCMEDFVAAVKEQFPKKEETFIVDLAFVDRKKMLEEIEKVSSALWFSNDKPTHCASIGKYLQITHGGILNSDISEGKTELAPAQFIEKCVELHPPKSVCDGLREGDICLVRDCKHHKWVVRTYRGNEFFVMDINNTNCGAATWEYVKPTGANVYDVLNDGPVTSHADCF